MITASSNDTRILQKDASGRKREGPDVEEAPKRHLIGIVGTCPTHDGEMVAGIGTRELRGDTLWIKCSCGLRRW